MQMCRGMFRGTRIAATFHLVGKLDALKRASVKRMITKKGRTLNTGGGSR